MQLYTSLVRLKQAMNGGQLPPMMLIPMSSLDVIDPRFTIGLGGLFEDEERGLRCPVIGCGEFHHNLTRHVNQRHSDVGGAVVVRQKLSIPHTAPLVSSSLRATLSESGHRTTERTPVYGEKLRVKARSQLKKNMNPKASGESMSRASQTVGFHNLRDRCEAQMSSKIIDLHHKLGRSPNRTEAAREYGTGLVVRVDALWGSWQNCLSQLGLPPMLRYRRYSRDEVLDGLIEWHRMHGELPMWREAANAMRVPLIAGPKSILRALQTDSWTEAMRRAASLLNIYGGRYGLPEKQGAA